MAKDPKKSPYEYAEISYDYLYETHKAVHVTVQDEDVWIPKSLTKDPKMDFEGGSWMEVKRWFAKQEGLV
jgi:hypothetical protein